MSPMQIWCNEAQERYVLAIRADRLDAFQAMCERERCPFAVVGEATGSHRLVVDDRLFGNKPVDMDLSVLLGKPPKMTRHVKRVRRDLPPLDLERVELEEAAMRVLRLPAVADKTFLISIGDRTVGGLCAAIRWSGRGRCRWPMSPSRSRPLTATRRSDGDGRACTAGSDRCARLGTHGDR